LHIGLKDEPRRLEVSREAYTFYKMKNPGTSGSTEKININGKTGVTKSIIKDGSAIFKLSEYNGTGHDIYRFPFDDKKLMAWLFEQILD